MMERYQGIKFHCTNSGSGFTYDGRLDALNRWAWIFSQLNLAPEHLEGAYGNFSYRNRGTSFIITKSRMIPSRRLKPENYSLIEDFEAKTNTFLISGANEPSSESFLHDRIYRQYADVQAILHGHFELFSTWASVLEIPVTQSFADYGTPALAESALDIISATNQLILLKDHGFVALGESIASAGCLVLKTFREMLARIEKEELD
jgi:ribulose-5-phosphate 4-epimerase/fuculose-1-phosphate aldolase